MIFQHEMIHARKLHSIDNYIINLVSIVHWFNPFVWLIKREIRNVHEYEADHETIQKNGDAGFYKKMLFSQAMRVDSLSLVNNFHSSIKNRLLMLQKKSSLKGLLRGFIFIPLALSMLFVFSCTEQNGRDSNMKAPPPDQTGRKVIENNSSKEMKDTPYKTEADAQIFVVVEEMPTFKGKGIGGFRDYIQENIDYPPEAAQKGIEGTVYVKFVVNDEGENTDIEVMRGVHETLDQVVVKAIQDAPDWKPGRQRGQEVHVQFTIPVVFKLED